MPNRSGTLLAVAILLLAPFVAREARAAADVHRFNLALSGIPTQISGGDFNKGLDQYNQLALSPRGWESIQHVAFTWAYDADLRYFVRPNLAVTAGIGAISAEQKKEFLPALNQDILLSAQLTTTPVHLGAAYYLQPYNQGDFQARMFFGGGFMGYTGTKATFSQTLVNADSLLSAQFGGTTKYVLTMDAPGYYAEFGGHMFFASRYSVLISAVYRSAVFRNTQLSELELNGRNVPVPPGAVFPNTKGRPFTLDMGGVGVRMAAVIGF